MNLSLPWTENRLTQVVGEAVTTYRYNGDGQRVTLTTGCTTTTYVGNYFEWTGSAAASTSYYYAGGTRIAMRTGTPLTGTVNYLLGDHLGSTSVSYRSDGGQTATQRYGPWGGVRATTGVLPTDYGFTGQKLDASAGLMYYGARYYDSYLNRWIQPDTIIPDPGDPQSLNRYSYVKNNPLRFVDPTGHVQVCADGDYGGGCGVNTLDSTQVFWHAAKIVPELAEFYAIRAQHARNVLEGAPEIVLEAGLGAMENAWLRGQAALPQARFDPTVLIDPGMMGSLAQVGGSVIHKGTLLAIGRLTRTPVQAGEAGGFADLQARRMPGDNLEPHHIPQKASGWTTPSDGGALMMTQPEHAQTRTYAGRGALTVNQDAGKSFRDVLAADLRDVRSIVGGRYNEGLRELLNYYRTNFPGLMQK